MSSVGTFGPRGLRRNPFRVISLAILFLCALGYAVTTMSTRIALGLGLWGCAVIVSSKWPEACLVSVLTVYLLALSIDPGFGVDIRLLAVPFVVILLAKASRGRFHAYTSARILWCFSGLAVLSLLSTIWSDDRAKTLGAFVSLVVVVATWWSSARTMAPDVLCRILRRFLCAAVLVSAILILTGQSPLGGRALGVFGNPNGLGLCIVIAIPVFLSGSRARLSLTLVAVLLLLSTGSRAAAVGVLVELLVLAYPAHGRGRKVAILFTVLAGLVGLSWLAARAPSLGEPGTRNAANTSILRRADSRSKNWSTAASLLQKKLPLGTGIGAARLDVASSYLKLVLEGGAIGALLGALALSGANRAASKAGRVGAALVAGGLANAIFESWLFVGGSWFSLIYWLLVMAFAAPGNEQRRSSVW